MTVQPDHRPQSAKPSGNDGRPRSANGSSTGAANGSSTGAAKGSSTGAADGSSTWAARGVSTWAAAAFIVAVPISTGGCRSAWPLASRGPSAEALAGAGPTRTYPVPPSHQATPQAIASIAGGTAAPPTASPPSASAFGTRLASAALDTTDSKISPVSNRSPAPGGLSGGTLRATPPRAPDYAAAAANGFPVPPGPAANPATPTSIESISPPPAAADDRTSAYGLAGIRVPSTAIDADAPSASGLANNTAPPATRPNAALPTPTATGSGMTLPETALDQIIARQSGGASPAADRVAVLPVSATAPNPAASPDSASAARASAFSDVTPSLPAVDPSRPYSPGSTSASGGYPTPQTRGSFYR